MTVDENVRQQMVAEIGEDELTSDQRYMLVQKYGLVIPRINFRNLGIKKPSWMNPLEWGIRRTAWKTLIKSIFRHQSRPQVRQVRPQIPKQYRERPTNNPKFSPR